MLKKVWSAEKIYIATGYTDLRREVEVNGKYGFINPNNQMVIPAIYNYVSVFAEGSAVVGTTTSGGYTMGIVDNVGNYTPIYVKGINEPLVIPYSGINFQSCFRNGCFMGFSFEANGI